MPSSKRKRSKTTKPKSPTSQKNSAPAPASAPKPPKRDADPEEIDIPPETILEADYKNLLKKVASGRPLTAAERTLVLERKTRSAALAPAKPNLPTYVTSKVALAAALGISRPTLDDWLTLPGHPKPDAGGRHSIAAWLAFRDAQNLKGADDLDPDDPETATDVAGEACSSRSRHIELKNEKLAEEIAILRRTHTPNEIFLADVTAFGAGLKSVLLQKEAELPALLAGKDIPAVRAVLRLAFDELRTCLQDLLKKWNT